MERKDRRQNILYESDADKTDEKIVEGLMEITSLSLTDLLAYEPAYNEGLKKGRHRFSTSFLPNLQKSSGAQVQRMKDYFLPFFYHFGDNYLPSAKIIFLNFSNCRSKSSPEYLSE